MSYIEDLELYQIVNLLAFLIGLLYGVVAQKTQFCFNGAIKDYVRNKSTRRAGSILVAMITAIVLSQLLSTLFHIDFTKTIYLQPNVNYVSIVFGGILFGVGMMLADGCSSRHLIKFSQGDIHSLVTILFIAVFAYMTSKGIFSYFFNLPKNNDFLLNISTSIFNQPLPIIIVILFLLFVLWRLIPTLKSILLCIDGLIIGLLVGSAWFTTGVVGLNDFGSLIPEGLSFVFPSGKTLEYLMFFSGSTLSFSVSVIFGILTGGYGMSFYNTKYRFNCATEQKDNKLKNAMIGGGLMGIGGILTLGCTVGQGLSGISTLAPASFIAIISISVAAYFTAVYMAKKNALPGCYTFEWSI